MKRNYLFKNIGRVLLSAGILTATLLTSCKDNSPGSIDFSKSPALIGWQYAGFQAVPYTATMLPTGTYTENLEVALSVSSVTLGSAVTATIVVDNTNLPSGFTALPTSLYTAPTSVTIPAGQQIVKVPIKFDAANIDFSQNYAIALKLTSANGAQIPSNLNVAVVELKVKSPYDDVYKVISGNTTPYAGGSVGTGVVAVYNISEATIDYSTLNVNTVTGQFGSSLYGLTAAITISGTTVHVAADPNATLNSTTYAFVDGNSSGTSSYDPSTKTLIIHAHYFNTSGKLREVNEDLVGE
jgi:hypothetical protein